MPYKLFVYLADCRQKGQMALYMETQCFGKLSNLYQQVDSLGAFGDYEVVTELQDQPTRFVAARHWKVLAKADEIWHIADIHWQRLFTFLWKFTRLFLFINAGVELYSERLSYAIIWLLFIVAINTSFCREQKKETNDGLD